MADNKTSQDSKYYRFRVSIPRSAKQVLELIDNQENVSYAVLHILREWVAQNGTDSVFGKPVDPVVKRGRPKGSVTQAFNDGQDDENKTAVSDMSDDDGFVDPNDLFARQEQNRRSGQSIANLLNNR